MIEPVKYEEAVRPSGVKYWKVTQAWKDWRKQVLSNGFEAHNKSKKPKAEDMSSKKIDPENHKFNWREVASLPSGRKIFFCACLSSTGEKYGGCGATAIQNARGSQMEIMVEPRFE